MKQHLLLSTALLSSLWSFGQLSTSGGTKVKQEVKITQNQSHSTHERCGFNQRHEYLMKTDPAYVAKREEIETQYQEYLKTGQQNKATYSIPVVVHVIHTGQAVGTGVNITDAQIQSAIDNLNAAFSNTSTAFTTYTGVNTNIQFCLAQRDPSGNPTTGIVRVNGSGVTQYSTKGVCDAGGGTGTDNEQAVKALSKWDNTKYYNIWVVNEINDNGGGAGTQGYAYFPGAGAAVDGTIILYNAFGYDPDGSLAYNLKNYTNTNSTAVHEIGHALNLFHTFEGDGTGSTCPGAGNLCGSGVGDCVSDTPPHKRSNSDCVTGGTNTCDGGSSNSLFVNNFMDYSSAACQTEFTSGQSTRMQAVMTGTRASLNSSNGCVPPNNNYDAAITSIVAPSPSYCQTTFQPQVTLRNFGLITMTSATITYNIDGGANQVFNWTGSLATGVSEVVTLNSMTTTTGAHTFSATVSSPNGNADAYAPNNTSSNSFTVTSSSAIPFTEDFEGAFPPANWSVVSADTYTGAAWDSDPSIRQWEKRAVTAESDGTAGNAAAINYVAYGFNTASIDELITPSINLSSASAPQMTFQLSYKYFGASNFERLRVLVSTDCGINYNDVVYDKQHTTLANMGQGSTSWAPTSSIHWRQETIDLSAYAGMVITLKFEGTNGYGNNLFIDKVNITDNCSAPVVTTNPSNSTICAANNSSFTVANTGGGTYQWQENNGGGFANITNGGIYSGATSATLTLTGATAGMNGYTYRCVITNGCGSVNSSSATLTVNSVATPTISASGATTFCSGSSVTLTSSSASGNLWSTGANTQSITVSSAGSYTVTVTASGCSATSAATPVTVNASPSISTGTTTNPSSCGTSTGSIVVNGSATGNLLWSGAATGNMMGVTLPQTITGLAAGTYSVSFNDGCASNVLSVTLTDPSAPATPTISSSDADNTICTGGSVTLTASAASGVTWSTGATTQSITVSAAGSYTVTHTVSGCSSTSSATTITVNAVPIIAIGPSTNPSACGLSDGTILVDGSGSGTLDWTGAATGSMSATLPATVSSLAAGAYDFTFTQGGCTSAISSQSLTDPAGPATPTISASGATTFCNGGSVTLTSSSASNNTWSTGETTSSITVTTGGNYTVTVNSGACTATSATTVVTVNNGPTITLGSSSNPSACSATDGSVTINGSGAGTLSWTGAASGSMAVTLPSTISGLGAGSYNFTFDDGCPSAAISASLSDPGAPATPTISSSDADNTICAGGSVTLTSSTSTGIMWSTGETTQSIIVNATGNYSVTTTVAGCSATSATTSVTVNTNPIITTGFTFGPSGCGAADGSIAVNGSGTGTVSWTGTASGSSTGSLPMTIGSLTAGTYNFTFNDGCVSNTVTATITDPGAPATPTISLSGATTFCTPGSVTLTSSSATDNVWSTGETTQSITVSSSGTYTLMVSVAGCNSGSVSEVVTAIATPATPTISASGSTTFCNGNSIDLTASTGTGILWSTGETTQTITVSASGSFTVTADNNGCTTTSAATTVTVNAVPSIAMGTTTDPTTCGGNDGSVQITGAGTGTLSWTGSNPGTASNITLPFTATGLAAGSYDFTFDDGCASNIISATLTDQGTLTAPTVSPSGPVTLCPGDVVTLTSSQTGGNVWSTGETTDAITVSAAGSYFVTASLGSCSATSFNVVVTVATPPAVPVITAGGALDFCAGGSVDLTSDVATGITWSTGETTQTITVTASGVYNVTASDGTCSSVSSPVTVTVNAIPATPIITADGPVTLCQGSSVNLTASTTTGTYAWSTGEATAAINVNTAGTYSVSITENGCTSAAASVVVTVNALPTVTLGSFANVCDTAAAFALTGGLPAGGSYTVNGTATTNFDPATANIGGNTIVYSFTDGNGCSSSASQTLVVDQCIGLDETAALQFTLFPNPAQNMIKLSGEHLKEIQSVELHDELGRILLTQKQLNNDGTLILNGVANGPYLLIIRTADHTETHRIQVMK